MELQEKLAILSAAAKYDASCASSGSIRANDTKGLGNASTAINGICHSWASDGRCISLLKVLMTNHCINDCVYCINRRSNDIPRSSFSVAEVVDLTINFYRRNYIEGLFLSSGVLKNADFTMESMVQIVKKLRREQNFNGYIHLKVIPGASRELIREAGFYADRLSVNIELPSENGLKLLAPQKRKDDILQPMAYIGSKITANHEEQKQFKKAGQFVPAGQSTQLIVGATSETDLQILRLSEGLYQRVNLKRVYYSAYIPVTSNPLLPALRTPPLKRENRLYQADWLLRFYGFRAEEVLTPAFPFLEPDLDPKTGWALRNMHLFPKEVNQADYHSLLRIPGIGVKSAQRVIAARRFGSLNFDDLGKLGVILKRARFFITCQGKFLEALDNEAAIRKRLLPGTVKTVPEVDNRQLSLFNDGLYA
jgi:putative DNA modification/repair radical SAM protein